MQVSLVSPSVIWNICQIDGRSGWISNACHRLRTLILTSLIAKLFPVVIADMLHLGIGIFYNCQKVSLLNN